jgi:ABC-2 type transport system permease protein/lipopolysaccharide transport system permease protein
MTGLVEQLDGPPPELRFRRRIRFIPAMRELWQARELVRSLVERELRAQYKQAVLGFAWAIITPVALLLVFSLFITRVATINTGGVPYVLFSYMGLLPWTFFSAAVMRGGLSLLTNAALLNKVYCPRESFPVASVVSAGIDTTIAALVLGILFVATGFAPKATSIFIPVILLVQVAFTLGLTLIVSAIVVYFRDLRHALPLILQFGILATPVAYGIDAIPANVRVLYAALNPLGPIIDGYRRVVLLGLLPTWPEFAAGACSSAVILVGSYLLFKHLEAGFPDLV